MGREQNVEEYNQPCQHDFRIMVLFRTYKLQIYDFQYKLNTNLYICSM